jgi:hypothetical protein
MQRERVHVTSDDLDIIADAERLGQRSPSTEPCARTARYDRRTGRVQVELTNGCAFAFPARSTQGLEQANDTELAQMEILGRGLGLRWERLDVGLSVPGLLAGLFGTKAYVDRQRAARAGAARSIAKAAAARRNGAKGGRPRKPVSARQA